ncbi:MAG: c-type cytochrome [Alphaproteobacteria bacterium]
MTFLRVAGFSLLIVLGYTLFTNIVPQIQSDPPKEEEVEVGALDRAGQIAWGERLFAGKGTCTLCHNKMGRAPDLLAMVLRKTFAARLADPRYDGKAKGLEGAAAIGAYLSESLLEPSAFVVAGYGKKGTSDTVSPMPNVGAAPIALSQPEITALIAFLEDRAGSEITVPLPAGAATAASREEETGEEGPAATARAAIEKFGCAACHDLFGSGADAGPKLAGIGMRLDREALRRAILDPNAEIAKGYKPDTMPTDFGKQMRASELELVIDYLMNQPAAEAAQ